MKKTRIAALALLVVVCIAGWAILSMDRLGEVKKQKNIIASAQYYRQKKLFQLSLSNYQSALESEPTEALYDEYLAACDEYFEDSATANVRGIQQSAYAAAVAEFPERADYWERYAALYYEDGDYDTLVDVLLQASKHIAFNETMTNYWNESYYACNISSVRYDTVTPAGSDGVYLGQNFFMDEEGELLPDETEMVLFGTDGGELLSGYRVIGPVGQSTAVLCADDKGECFVYQMSQSLMVGRFMLPVEQAKGYGDGLIPVRLSGQDGWSYIDIDGNVYLQGYQDAGMFQNSKAAVQNTAGEWYLVDESGEPQSESYEDICMQENGAWLTGGVYLAKKNGKWNFYDESGAQKGDLDADDVDRNLGDGLAFEKNGKWGFALLDGSVVIEPQYDGARSFSNGVAAVYKNGKWGFVNTGNTLVIEYLLDDASYFDANGCCFVREEDSLRQLSWRVERD